jgi:hypothetical protein
MSTPDREAVTGHAVAFDYEATLAACADGDRGALRALYDREAGRLMGVKPCSASISPVNPTRWLRR